MARFSYKAFDNSGELESGDIKANSEEEALNLLSQKMLTPISIKQEKESQNGDLDKQRNHKNSPKVKPQSVLVFTLQLLAMIRTGLPLAESIELVIEQSTDEKMDDVLKSLNSRVREGKSFSESLREFPRVFSEFYINSIQVGETGGILERSLENLASQLESEMNISKNLRKALSYPAFLIIALFMAFIVFITFVIPKFIPIFTKSGTELPLPTKVIILISEIINDYGLVILLIFGLIGFAYYSYSKTVKGKYKIHYYLLKLPLIGEILKKISSQRFCKTIAILVGQGLPLVNSMNTAVITASNPIFKEKIETVRGKVESGRSFSDSMKDVNIFPKMMIHMISVGERTGTLEQMMNKVAEFYQSEVASSLDKFTALIEPAVTVILAVFVLFLALSIFLPMWNMMGIR